MKRFEKILVCLNMDDGPDPALDMAKQYARDLGTQLTLVDVVDDTGWELAHAIRPGWKFRETLLQARCRQLVVIERGLAAQGLSVSSELLVGRPSIEIIRLVLRGGHDLIMKAARPDQREHGPSYGTVALRLLRMCSCPVWIVQPPLRQTSRILAAVDPQEDAEDLGFRILELASMISQWQKAELHVVHAWGGYGHPLFKGAFSQAELSALLLESQAKAEKRLQALLARLPSGIPAGNVHLIQGEAHQVISRHARQYGVDLVVMGTVARRGLAGLITGNTAERLLHRLSYSLLAIKPEGFVTPVTLDESLEENLGGTR